MVLYTFALGSVCDRGLALVLTGGALTITLGLWPRGFQATPTDHQVAKAFRRFGGRLLALSGALYSFPLVFGGFGRLFAA